MVGGLWFMVYGCAGCREALLEAEGECSRARRDNELLVKAKRAYVTCKHAMLCCAVLCCLAAAGLRSLS